MGRTVELLEARVRPLRSSSPRTERWRRRPPIPLSTPRRCHRNPRTTRSPMGSAPRGRRRDSYSNTGGFDADEPGFGPEMRSGPNRVHSPQVSSTRRGRCGDAESGGPQVQLVEHVLNRDPDVHLYSLSSRPAVGRNLFTALPRRSARTSSPLPAQRAGRAEFDRLGGEPRIRGVGAEDRIAPVIEIDCAGQDVGAYPVSGAGDAIDGEGARVRGCGGAEEAVHR